MRVHHAHLLLPMCTMCTYFVINYYNINIDYVLLYIFFNIKIVVYSINNNNNNNEKKKNIKKKKCCSSV